MSATVQRIISATAALCIMPTAAFAVNVSSGSGSGWQERTESYPSGAKVAGKLRSTSGNAVYYQGNVALGGCNDVTVGRYSTNTSSTTQVDRGGTITTGKGPFCSFQGVRSKICRDVSGAPDLCGPWSTRY